LNRLLIASVDRFGPLREGVRERLTACSQTREDFEAGALIFTAGERSRLRLLARGLAIKETVLPDGGRQIFGVATPGDLIDVSGLFAGADYDLRALGPCEVRKTSARELKSILQDNASLLDALCRAVLTEARAQRNWMVGLGRRSAMARTANLLCEIYWRQESLALARDGRCDLPAVQNDIADALGLSVVHIHRVLRALRDDGLATLRNGALHILDWEQLTALGSFDPEALRPQRDLDDLAAPSTPPFRLLAARSQ
jgi:CRP-like cAMP-binding protein